MKKLILTSAFILGSVITLFAQANKPGQPIGGIVVKGGITSENKADNPLYEATGNAQQNPMAAKQAITDMSRANTQTNPYFKDNELAGELPNNKATGNPIGGIIVKGAKTEAAAVATNPLYTGSGTQGSNPLYKGKD